MKLAFSLIYILSFLSLELSLLPREHINSVRVSAFVRVAFTYSRGKYLSVKINKPHTRTQNTQPVHPRSLPRSIFVCYCQQAHTRKTHTLPCGAHALTRTDPCAFPCSRTHSTFVHTLSHYTHRAPTGI